MDGELVRQVSRAIHEHLCKRDIMQYLDNDEDCEGLARAAITALQPMLDKARAEGREAGIMEALEKCADISRGAASVGGTSTALLCRDAIRDLLYVEIPRIER